MSSHFGPASSARMRRPGQKPAGGVFCVKRIETQLFALPLLGAMQKKRDKVDPLRCTVFNKSQSNTSYRHSSYSYVESAGIPPLGRLRRFFDIISRSPSTKASSHRAVPHDVGFRQF